MGDAGDPEGRVEPAKEESTEDLIGRRGSPVLSIDGKRVGEIEEVFEDAETGMPEWIGLGSGLFFARRVLVPLLRATVDDQGVHTVQHTKDVTDGAPEAVIEDEFLTPESERELAAYYGLPAPPDRGAPRLRARRYLQDEPAEPPPQDGSAEEPD